MSGRGSRFAAAGYTVPKPLVEVHGVPMIDLVVANLRPTRPHRFIFVCLSDHVARYGLEEHLAGVAPGCLVLPIDETTEGAAVTVLTARRFIATAQPLLIANSDQWIDASIDAFLRELADSRADGLIMTMRADDPKWSFVRLAANGEVLEVAEKRVISDEATVGIYAFAHGQSFVEAADRMIAKDIRVNGEFYVAPVYNECIGVGHRIRIFNVGRVGAGMYGLGTPNDLEAFAMLRVSERATASARKIQVPEGS